MQVATKYSNDEGTMRQPIRRRSVFRYPVPPFVSVMRYPVGVVRERRLELLEKR